MKAMELIVAPRMPERPKSHTGNPFTTEGDIVADCAKPGCGWHAMGPRALIREAIRNHLAMCHSQEIGQVLLNQPRQ